jgi:hypothetical protein|tara:strand:+ start:558 stop:737 length:180 start_codon:yes stop_codon:yes gene_type:complete
MAEEEEKCCDKCCTQTILDKIDKQNFINMNYQNENDNGFNSTLSKLNDILELLQKHVEK